MGALQQPQNLSSIILGSCLHTSVQARAEVGQRWCPRPQCLLGLHCSCSMLRHPSGSPPQCFHRLLARLRPGGQHVRAPGRLPQRAQPHVVEVLGHGGARQQHACSGSSPGLQFETRSYQPRPPIRTIGAKRNAQHRDGQLAVPRASSSGQRTRYLGDPQRGRTHGIPSCLQVPPCGSAGSPGIRQPPPSDVCLSLHSSACASSPLLTCKRHVSVRLFRPQGLPRGAHR